MLLDLIQNQSILILGFGREGQSTFRYLRRKFPYKHLTIADKNPFLDIPNDSNLTVQTGPEYLNYLLDFNIIIKSPGISPHLPEITEVKKQEKRIISQTQIFLEQCPGEIIGVTGTKGKSTTTALIHHVLQKNGVSSELLGNIGIPPLDNLELGDEKTFNVFEMSSHQLMDVTKSPHIAVFQNVLPEHLDYYSDFDEYISAKQKITKFQTPEDYFIYNADFPIPTRTAKLTFAKKIPFSIRDFDPKIKSQLLGEFNKYNILPAIAVGVLMGLSHTDVYKAIESFYPLDHRLKMIGLYRGISFFDAALATIPEATMGAIDALGINVHTLICGGHERQQNYENLAQKIVASHIRTIILFPATGQRIWDEIERISKPNSPIKHFFVDDMAEAVNLAYQNTPSGKICLLAPAAPSFTIFKNYSDEAQQYKNCVLKFSKM